jgi:hypothetical protein
MSPDVVWLHGVCQQRLRAVLVAAEPVVFARFTWPARLPIVPGGLGIVESSLAVILAVYGVARVPAISVALAHGRVSL